MRCKLMLFCLVTFLMTPVHALKFFDEPDAIEPVAEVERYQSWLREGELDLAVRLFYIDRQHESALVTRGAQHSSLQTALRFESATWQYLSFAFDVTHTAAIPDDDNYFDGGNGETDDLFIAAPEGVRVNEGWLQVNAANTVIRYGRQALHYNDGRMIGQSDWQPLRTSVSGVSVVNSSLNVTRFRLASLYAASPVAAPRDVDNAISISGRYAQVDYLGFIHSRLSLYFLDLEADDDALWDTRTLGARFAGEIDSDFLLFYDFAYAAQESIADNPNDYRAHYQLVMFGGGIKAGSIGVGEARLGSDGDGFFVTPLADLQAHQGWSNQFANGGLGNLPGGVVDRFIELRSQFTDTTRAQVRHHWFSPDDAAFGGRWGREVNVGIEYLNPALGVQVALRGALFEGERLANDERSVWLQAEYRFP